MRDEGVRSSIYAFDFSPDGDSLASGLVATNMQLLCG